MAIPGARAAADPQTIGVYNHTNGSHRGGVRIHIFQNSVIVGIHQADPATIEAAPPMLTNHLGLQNGQFLTIKYRIDLLVLDAGAVTNVNIIGSNHNIHSSLIRGFGSDHLRSSLAQVHPLVIFKATPLDIVCINVISNDLQFGTLRQSGNSCQRSIRKSLGLNAAVTNIAHIVAGSTDGFAVTIQSAFALLPASKQSDALSLGIQRCHPSAAFLCGIPAQKTVSFSGGNRLNRSWLAGIIALDIHDIDTTVVVIQNITVITGRCLAVTSIQVHSSLSQTAIDQCRMGCTADLGPTTNSINKVIVLQPLHNGVIEQAIRFSCPSITAVVCKKNQRVKHILRQLQILLVRKGIDRILKGTQVSPHQGVGFHRGNTVGLVIFILIIRAAAAVTNRILATVRNREFAETLHIFEDLNAVIAGLKGRCSGNFHRQHGEQTHQHHHRQKGANQSFFHDNFSFSRVS